jgi:hypothetical protein
MEISFSGHRSPTIGDSTIADAILDRMVHTAHRIELKGESMIGYDRYYR